MAKACLGAIQASVYGVLFDSLLANNSKVLVNLGCAIERSNEDLFEARANHLDTNNGKPNLPN